MLVSCAGCYLANTLLRMFNDESHSTFVYVNICPVICQCGESLFNPLNLGHGLEYLDRGFHVSG